MMTKKRLRSHVAGLMLGGAVSCLLVAPAAAGGYASPVNWSGFYVSAGIGATAMSTDTKVDARREDDVQLEIECSGTSECEFDGPNGEFELEADTTSPELEANLNFLQQQLLEMDGLSDIGVYGVLSAGWDHRLAGSNFVLGAFAGIEFYDVESDFKSQGWAQTQTSIEIFGSSPEVEFEATNPDGDDILIGGALFGAAIANGVGDGHIEVDGKVKQDYSYHVGGRLGYILNENLMTYFGAAWTRTSIDGHVNVNISDPVCVSNNCQNSLAPSPTSFRVDLDEDVDGYKLLAGGEYALGHAMGGNWFLRGEASFSDYDGISAAFSGQKKQMFEFEPGSGSNSDAEIEIERLINESASVHLDKEDLSVHAALVFKLGGAPAPVYHKPMK